MNIQTTIQKILVEADERLRQAIADAATAGDLEAVDMARSAAGRLRQMINGLDEAESATVNSAVQNSRGPAPADQARRRKPTKRKSNYPKYEVRGGFLCRIGWSKKERKEYEHKVAKDVFDETINAMEKLSHDQSGPITADKIIGKVNKLSATTIPNYQVYVVIGLLRDHRDIAQVGRQGYNIPETLRETSFSRWNKMAGGDK